MSEADFDISGLAAYLHLLPQQVQRLAERGKVPGRKVGGQWRFSRAEIHHWLESRIGALDDDAELADMEGVLQRSSVPETAVDSIAEVLAPDRIAVPLAAKTREGVIQAIVQVAADTGLLWDPEKMAEAVRIREEMHSTALAGGVALLHPRRPMPAILAEPFVVLGRTTQGIPFGGGRGQLTDIFFLICSVSDAGHLQTLARLARLVNDADVLNGIREAEQADEVYKLLVDAESALG
jgi:PTS system nitrogen regulatory IIA component